MIGELLTKARSYRRFHADMPVPRDTLLALVGAVRLCPSAGNRQRVRLVIVRQPAACDALFSTLRFAAYLRDWQGPAPGERPAAYLIFMTEEEADTNLAIDIGIAAEAVNLTAAEMGLGCCMLRAFSPRTVGDLVGLAGWHPQLVMAIGTPAEKVRLTDVTPGGDIRYYRDADGVHTVPKYPTEAWILKEM